MTIIELIDKPAIENFISILQLRPDKVVFLTIEDEPFDRWADVFSKFSKKNNVKITAEMRSFKKESIEDTAGEINELLTNLEDEGTPGEEIYFDILGGRERILLSIGYLMASDPDHGFHIIRPDFTMGKILDVETGKPVISNEPEEYPLKYMFQLFDGTLIDFEKPCDNKKDFPNTASDGSALSSLFQINAACSYIKKLYQFLTFYDEKVEESRLEIWLEFTKDRKSLNKRLSYITLSNELKIQHMISSYHFGGNNYPIKFSGDDMRTPEEVFYIASEKYGTILELYIGVLVKEILNEAGKKNARVYHSVKIDWDGVIQTTCNGKSDPGATNEIDVMTVINYRPAYISCKLGKWDQDELFKLSSVAEHFGGKYSRKLLVSYKSIDDLNPDKDSCRILNERAADMGIKVIDNLKNTTEQELKNKIRDAIK